MENSASNEKTKVKKVKEFEIDYLKATCARIEKEVIRERLNYLFAWYTRKAEHNKRLYNAYRTASYVLPCVITIANVLVFLHIETIISIISVVVSVLLAFINHRTDHYRYYENWIRYRNTAEQLKRQALLFLNKCEPYNKETNEENEKELVQQIEVIAAYELIKWENLQAESNNQPAVTPISELPAEQAVKGKK